MNQLTVADRERRRVGATIRALRQKIGATPDQLAHRVGIARPTPRVAPAARPALVEHPPLPRGPTYVQPARA